MFVKKSSADTVAIISGEYKHARLAVPATAHPMGNRERLALFNMVDPAGCTVLDLFAGSGALGLEALSRGAASVTFVEKNPAALQKNLQKIFGTLERGIRIAEVQPSTSVIAKDVFQITPTEHDLVFVDPPYDHPEYFTAESITFYAQFVKSGATLVISHPKTTKIPPTDTLKLEKTRNYAGLTLDIFHKL